ncbi:MAG: hypothetical protein PHW01_02370 [Patescibacteria group bacterium]|nr:hypothetical protein [Patescibacteria group bacterium]
MSKKRRTEQKRKTPRHKSSQDKQKHHYIGKLRNDPYCKKSGGYDRNEWREEASEEVDLFSGYEE